MPQRPKIIELYAQLNFDKQEVKAKQVFGNAWDDFGLYLEVLGFMAARVVNETPKNQRQVLEYIDGYVTQCIESYATSKKSPYSEAMAKTIDENRPKNPLLDGSAPLDVPGVHDGERKDEDNGQDLLPGVQ